VTVHNTVLDSVQIARCTRTDIELGTLAAGTLAYVSVPRFALKQHGMNVIVTPEASLQHRRDLGQPIAARIPEAIILTYQPQLVAGMEALEQTTRLPIGGPARVVHALDRTDHRVGVVGRFGIGAPVAAVVLEELIALGARRFLSIGVAGGLHADLEVGEPIVCSWAVRDEGVSHHYLPPDVIAAPNADLTASLADQLTADGLAFRTGASWTIDAIFQETVDEAVHYADQGVLTVEMEAAALFAVAACRGVPLASAFCVSDSLAGGEWEPSYGSDQLARNVWALFQSSVTMLGEI
jgi:uridine phosphorylase